MITTESIKTASSLASNASFSGKKLVPVGATPLSLMVRTLAGIEETGDDVEIINAAERATSTEGSYYDVEEDISKKISRIMGNIVDTAKNRINPICREIIKLIETDRENNRLVHGKLDVTIVQVDMPPLFIDATFQQLIDSYKNVILPMPEDAAIVLSRLNGYFTSDELLLLLQTGSASLDARVTDYINGDMSIFSTMAYAANISDLELRDAVLYFLFLTGIKNGKLDKADALVEDSAINATLSTLRALLGRRIYNDIARWDNDMKTTNLTSYGRYMPTSYDKTIAVVGKNYRDWINTKGGSPEALLGFYIDNGFSTRMANTSALLQDPEHYVAIYNRHLIYINSMNILHDKELVRNTISYFIADKIRTGDYEDKVTLQNRLNAALLTVDYHGKTVLHKYVIHIATAVFTEGDDVRRLLYNIDDVLSEMETPDLQYAVYMGCIQLVASWLASQITVVQ